MKTQRIVDADDEDFDSLFASEEEKRDKVLNTEDGEKLVYAGGNVWLAEPAAPVTDEEKAAYESRFSHPKISVGKTELQLILPPVVTAAAATVLRFTAGESVYAFGSAGYLILMAAGALLLYTLLRLRSVIIFAVQVYQVVAPMRVRERCSMVPTCSDYMILAVRKYGALRGLIKGIKRLRRCDGMYRVDMP